MGNITFEVVENDDIEQCRDLCNELMSFQKSQAVISPEGFNSMNFDTRMKLSYESALEKQVIIVKDDEEPFGYIFSTIDMVTEEMRDMWPDWVPRTTGGVGFYPEWLSLPQKVGCLSNLYLRDAYKGHGFGSKLCEMSMEWLGSFTDVPISFVYISNGNDRAYEFYIRKGFIPSHDVFGGFIKAAYFKL